MRNKKERVCYTRVRALREDKDWNQTKIAKLLNMSQTGYSKYETGENDIPTEVLIGLAVIHHTSIDYLLGMTDHNRLYPCNDTSLERHEIYRKRIKELANQQPS